MIWATVSSRSQFLSHYLISTPALGTQHWETAENMGTWEQGQTGCVQDLRCGPWRSDSPLLGLSFLIWKMGITVNTIVEGYCEAPVRWGKAWHSLDTRSQGKWLIFTSLQSTELCRISEVTEGRRFQTTLRKCPRTHVSSSPQENASECMGSHLRFHLLPRNITPQSHLCLWGKIENPTNYF